MKKIFGQVLVKETNIGISNLIVTAYDSEKSFEEFTSQEGGKRKISLDNLGKRIGSVLTDSAGKFELTTDELEFQGNESRPDLLLVIFAPEDVTDKDQPFPLPPEDRILYISRSLREDAGAEETYFIRLSQSCVEKFDLAKPDEPGLSSSWEETWRLRDEMKKRLSERSKHEQEQIQKRREEAEKRVRKLSAIPLHLRRKGKRKNLLQNNAILISDRKHLSEQLGVFQFNAIKDGLDALKKRAEDNTKRQPTLRVHLTKEEWEKLGLKEENGQFSGEVTTEALWKKVRTLSNVRDLTKIRGLENPSLEELERKYRLPVPTRSDLIAEDSDVLGDRDKEENPDA